jgi:hypothetical protein
MNHEAIYSLLHRGWHAVCEGVCTVVAWVERD